MAFYMQEIDGRPLLLSRKLELAGVPHAFGTRLGGASRGPVAGANLSFFNGDQEETVRANWTGLLSRCGLGGRRLHYLRQVHGTRVVPVRDSTSSESFRHQGEGDGLHTDAPGQALAVITADCVPVLLYFAEEAEGPERVAALHAGWRGVVAGILPKFLRSLGRLPQVVALGPHIRQAHFQVGEEVLPDFQRAFQEVGGAPPGALQRGPGDRWLVDLEALLLAQLEDLGVPRERVEVGAPCTFADPENFFSFRRDGPGRGSLGHAIGLPPGRPE